MDETPKNENENVVPIRSPKGQFVKGVSGNPAGKPKVREIDGDKIEVAKLYKDHGPEAARVLIKLMKNPKMPPQVQFASAREILNRAYGAPKETVETISKTDAEDQNKTDWSKLTVEEQRQILALLRKTA